VTIEAVDVVKFLRNQWDRVGALLWLSADLRDEWRKLDAIDRHLQAEGTLAPPEDRVSEAGPPGQSS
jgi:hypothetical protein